MQIRAVYSRPRDRPTDAHIAFSKSRTIKNKDKAENEHTEPFRAVLLRVMKEGKKNDKGFKG